MSDRTIAKIALMWAKFIKEWSENPNSEVILDNKIQIRKPGFYDFMDWYMSNASKFLDK
jgi:hypothetical protein